MVWEDREGRNSDKIFQQFNHSFYLIFVQAVLKYKITRKCWLIIFNDCKALSNIKPYMSS